MLGDDMTAWRLRQRCRCVLLRRLCAICGVLTSTRRSATVLPE